MKKTSGECCFFTALLGIVILIGCLFILGVPKFVIGIEYLDRCPAAPLIPLYLCVSGLLGVAGVGHSVFLWTCLYRKHMKENRKTHSVCLVLWVLLMFTIPAVQLVGGPYVIYTYHTDNLQQERCGVIANMTSSPLYNQSLTSVPFGFAVTMQPTNQTGSSYTVITDEKRIHLLNEKNSMCAFCDDVIITCAYVTSVFELGFMTVPLLCFVTAALIFRVRKRRKLAEQKAIIV
ncbi:uncharacterized protein LOC124122367 isoform X2 [Haliotis rufescens]|uniref:uncharacterized protein LOC124122367 isoform X2 n=1 Tax=Haliotis rufescens TaxID=6454 RepID=UPI00201EA6E7|nr:uncharacterized protein LOC124122367 isoform X2 [Haliotis rufescens]XP_048245392.1 uncharacterized protein LOC124122367 isoform X2 [Haliotis rufescens]